MDTWSWTMGGNDEFLVKTLKQMVSLKILGEDADMDETKWCKYIPNKVSIFMWRLKHGRLTVRALLDRYGIDMDTTLCQFIIMVNVIPPNHDHDVPVVEPNQHDDVLVVPELVLEDEDEDPEEDEFKEEEDPQEDEDDMEIDIEEDENEPELTYPYEEVDPLNPSPPASESEPDNEIDVENPIEHEGETIHVSIYEVGESSTTAIPREDGDRLLPGFMRRDIDSFWSNDLGNEVRSSVEQGTAAMEKLVEKLENVEEKAECKKLKKELEEARLSNTFLRMQNERVERDLYWTRVRAHEFYQEMIHRGFVFEERLNEAIDVPIEDEKSPLSEPRGSPPDVIMPPKSAPMTQAAIRRMIKESVDAAIAAERARQANVRNDASGSGPVRFCIVCHIHYLELNHLLMNFHH
ncbi:hypothetical protein Tco_0524076 [Tanacetum coccineum]